MTFKIFFEKKKFLGFFGVFKAYLVLENLPFNTNPIIFGS